MSINYDTVVVISIFISFLIINMKIYLYELEIENTNKLNLVNVTTHTEMVSTQTLEVVYYL